MQKQLYNDYIQTHFTQEKSSQCRGFQILLILDQWVISFHAMVLFGLGKNLLSKSVLGRCDVCTIALHIQSTRVSYSRWSTKQSMKGCQSLTWLNKNQRALSIPVSNSQLVSSRGPQNRPTILRQFQVIAVFHCREILIVMFFCVLLLLE